MNIIIGNDIMVTDTRIVEQIQELPRELVITKCRGVPAVITDISDIDNFRVVLVDPYRIPICLPDKTYHITLRKKDEGITWFETPLDAPHLETAACALPLVSTWEITYIPTGEDYLADFRVKARTEWDARNKIAKKFFKEPETEKTWFWWSPTHSTFTMKIEKYPKDGEIEFTRKSCLPEYDSICK